MSRTLIDFVKPSDTSVDMPSMVDARPSAASTEGRLWAFSRKVLSLGCQGPTLILLVLAVGASLTGALGRLDLLLYDTGQRWVRRTPAVDVVVVAIDEQSLQALGRWPWPRSLHAQLLDRLRAEGARAVGFDVHFPEPREHEAHGNDALVRAMDRSGNVVLPLMIQNLGVNGYLLESPPQSALVRAAAGLGRTQAELGPDGVARGIVLWEGLGKPTWPHFTEVVLDVARGEGVRVNHWNSEGLDMTLSPVEDRGMDESPFALIGSERRYINFYSGHAGVPSISYSQVLRGEFPSGLLRGKIVLVGATAAGIAAAVPTPVSGGLTPMPRVEFLANALTSMRDGTLIRHTSWWLSALLCGMLALVPMAWLPRMVPHRSVLVCAAYVVLLVAFTMALPLWGHIWLPTAGALLAAINAYPIWAWRKLRATSHFLDRELARLTQQLPWVGDGATRASADPFENRLLKIQVATQTLADMETERQETLAFISHDLRAPLVSARIQLEMQKGPDDPMVRLLDQSLALAEDFLQASRAQMSDGSEFELLDICAVVHQAADDLHALAHSRGVHLVREIPNEPTWVHGQFDLLHRAVVNLLVNAIPKSPLNGHVILSLQADARGVHVSVIDEGPGIQLDQRERLFQRFSRRNAGSRLQSGAGLGLYFVHIVATRHGGSVQVDSRPGSTVFRLTFPGAVEPHAAAFDEVPVVPVKAEGA